MLRPRSIAIFRPELRPATMAEIERLRVRERSPEA
jgi:hypothetical protein